jgi:anaerobic magnesium-protoporphyrin IX monomethyl ester cyclase
MKVCLVNPPWITKKGNIWHAIKCSMPPLGLLYLAAILEKNNISTDMLDFQALSLDWKQIEEKIALSEYDFWGVTSTTVIAGNAYKIADLIKKYHPHTKIVLGGVHATALPEEGLLNQNIDYVIRGEGEQALIELLQGFPPDTIKGLSYRSGNEFAHIRPDGLMRRLDDIPMPAFEKVDLSLYKPAFGAGINW